MRIRCKPWAKPELESCPFYIKEPTALAGHWAEQFPEKAPLRLELGCGKGGFIATESVQNPAYNYVAIDIKNEMLVLAKRKIEKAYADENKPIDNVWICIGNIMYLREMFAKTDRVDRIYINFCNPWSHNQHKKRRLTHPRQLVQYAQILDGEIWFKTDDDELFEESVVYFEETGYHIREITRDLHARTDLIYTMTEHEKMFLAQGKKIKFLIATKGGEIDPHVAAQLLKYSEREKTGIV